MSRLQRALDEQDPRHRPTGRVAWPDAPSAGPVVCDIRRVRHDGADSDLSRRADRVNEAVASWHADKAVRTVIHFKHP